MSTLASFSVATKALAVPPDDPDTPRTFWEMNGDCPNTPGGKPPCPGDDVILKWDDELLQAVRANPAATGPTVTARALGVLHTATYDAWAAYDPVAKVTRPDGPSQQPKTANILDNKKEAISYAAYQVLVDLFPSRTTDFNAQMAELNYPVNGTSTASAVGTQAAQAVLKFRHADGSNQTLDTKGTADPIDDTVSYPDPAFTPIQPSSCYTPKNTWNTLPPPDGEWHWQPLCVLTATGVTNGMPPIPPEGNNCEAPNYTVQKPLTPQWGNVPSFPSRSAIQEKQTGPPT